MEQLRFTAVHEDGQHLVLSTADGTELLLPVDARLRAALRTRTAPADAPATPLSPRNVQAMIRAGQSPEEVAEITGWPAERVARFEGPILAEREHVSTMAQGAHVRGRAAEGGVATLGSRVLERLGERGVDTDNVGWDATRPEGGTWTVVVSFVAGQRQRAAAWHFDPMDRTVEALDDEARWLSEDEQALPGIAAGGGPSRGGAPAKPLLRGRSSAGEVELMTSMRERSRSRGRRKKASTSTTDPAGLPQLEHAPEDVLPLEDLAYDPDTMGLPPAAHGESPAPGVAVEPEPEPEPDERADRDPAERSRAGDAPQDGTAGRNGGLSGYDVPLQFDNDDEPESDPSPREATLDDLFGPEEGDEVESDETGPEEIGPEEIGPDDVVSDENGPDGDGSDENGPDDDDVELELGEDPVAEDAAELGGDLDDLEETDSPETANDVETDAPEAADDVETAAPVEAAEGTATDEDTSVAESDSEQPAEPADDVAGGEDPRPTEADSTDSEPAQKPAGKRRPARRKDGRPGVPSWDDIMFGAKDRRS